MSSRCFPALTSTLRPFKWIRGCSDWDVHNSSALTLRALLLEFGEVALRAAAAFAYGTCPRKDHLDCDL